MKQQIVNRKITALIFTVMFLIYGITSLGSAQVEEEDTTAPTVSSVSIVTHQGGNYRTGQTIQIRVIFSENVTVNIEDGGWLSVGIEIINYNPDPSLGTIISEADYVAGSGLRVLRFEYTVRASDVDPDGFRILANSIHRYNSTITDGAGNEADYSHNAVDAACGRRVNTAVCGEPSQADALPSVSSEERARIAGALAMDRVIFNELRNATTDTHDWIELRNVSNADVTLEGWEVRIIADAGTGIVTFPSGRWTACRGLAPAGEH